MRPVQLARVVQQTLRRHLGRRVDAANKVRRVARLQLDTKHPGRPEILLHAPLPTLTERLETGPPVELQHDRGMSVLLVTHDLTEAHFLAERISVLIDGAQPQSGDKAEIHRRPATVAVARFLGIKNLYSASVVGGNLLDCPALAGRLDMGTRGGLRVGTVCTVCIRAERVALRSASDPPREGELRLNGRFEAILDLGDEMLLRFKPEGGTGTLELKVGTRVARRRLSEVEAPGVVGLPTENLIVLTS